MLKMISDAFRTNCHESCLWRKITHYITPPNELRIDMAERGKIETAGQCVATSIRVELSREQAFHRLVIWNFNLTKSQWFTRPQCASTDNIHYCTLGKYLLASMRERFGHLDSVILDRIGAKRLAGQP